jgi:poly-gamma-glutamate synthesis protein (capsule biosynthesis protein)
LRRNARKNQKKSSIFSQISSLPTKVVVLFLLFAFFLFLLIYVGSRWYSMSCSRCAIQNDLSGLSSLSENGVQDEPKKDSNEIQNSSKLSPTTFTMAAIGDVMCHNTQYWDAYQKETDDYDFSYVFDDIMNYTKLPDITVGSLETSFAGKERGYSNYPTFNSPDNLAYSLRKIGLDVLSTAGNHCLDMGFSGLSRTLDVLDDSCIAHVGTNRTQEEQNKILYQYVKGVKIAFLNYTYGTNGIPIPEGKEFAVNLIDRELMTKQIEQAKKEEADVIVSCMHWGTEYRTTANEEQKELTDFLFSQGVDIILGNHPHVLEPMEKRSVTLPDGTKKDGFVIYAFGNFICDQNAENTRNSIILNLKITKQIDGSITIDQISYTPIHMYKNPSRSLRKFKVLDIRRTIENYENGSDTSIGKTKYLDLKNQLTKIETILGDKF